MTGQMIQVQHRLQARDLLGRDVELVVEDTQLKPARGKMLLTKLYGDDKVIVAEGEIDEAIAWIETAYAERRPWLVGWLRTPVLTDNLRHDPRFQDILRRMKLPPTSS